jgi:NADPH-dependent curcumin reductase CurA
MKENRQILIKSLPQGKLEASNFCLELATMPVLGDDQVLVKTTAFSISAGARAGLQGSASYAGAPAAGRVMNGSGIGQVVESRCKAIPAGQWVKAPTGWQDYSVHNGADTEVIPDDHDPVSYLGPLGVNGLTAYFGVTDIGQPQEGDTVLVSAAAGSVGSSSRSNS